MPKNKIVDIKSLYYITHIENLPSIFEHGILCHSLLEEKQLVSTAIYDNNIVNNRKEKLTPDGKKLWDFANFYFQPRNPMLYRVVNEKSKDDIVVLGIRPQILTKSGIYLTDGNAANTDTNIYTYEQGLKSLSEIWEVVSSEWWNSVDGSKRKIMAECLIPDLVSPNMIHTIYVSNNGLINKTKELLPKQQIAIIAEPKMFFYPVLRRITKNLFLVEGDMFFSKAQTLTVSVNTVGVMGKGLASRAKYQFPDVYVKYQEVCRSKELTMGNPYLYKREASFDYELADEPSTLNTINAIKWFLLFPTKHHWRKNSDLQGIEKGLNWIVENYEKEKIKSLALPALGCGLGNLEWKDVGPMMCRYLSKLSVSVLIYLPREIDIPNEQRTAEFLLKNT
ncbi:MAG: DarT ssDNA thymidine ADP-ribosyltransferase family protein [Blastocatellia bacterium]